VYGCKHSACEVMINWGRLSPFTLSVLDVISRVGPKLTIQAFTLSRSMFYR